MIQITNVDELNKILRTELITQSQVSADNVRNGLSLQGSMLDKSLDRTNEFFSSLDVTDLAIIFELSLRHSSSNVTMSEKVNEDGNIISISSYDMHVIIYGNDSINTALKTIARLRSEVGRMNLYSKGVYLESIDEPTSFNEFINETMWLRTDFSINVSCEMCIEKVSSDYDITVLSGLQIKEEK